LLPRSPSVEVSSPIHLGSELHAELRPRLHISRNEGRQSVGLPYLRLCLPLLMPPHRSTTPYQPDRPTFWQDYGKAIRWFSIMFAVCLSPLGIIAIVDPAQAAEQLRVLGISTLLYVLVVGPVLAFYVRKDTY
jgi:hypothetical protein